MHCKNVIQKCYNKTQCKTEIQEFYIKMHNKNALENVIQIWYVKMQCKSAI
jgi:hypothetical protein